MRSNEMTALEQEQRSARKWKAKAERLEADIATATTRIEKLERVYRCAVPLVELWKDRAAHGGDMMSPDARALCAAVENADISDKLREENRLLWQCVNYLYGRMANNVGTGTERALNDRNADALCAALGVDHE